jgi:hypothetical protein
MGNDAPGRVHLTNDELRLILAILLCRPSQAPANTALVARELVRKLKSVVGGE